MIYVKNFNFDKFVACILYLCVNLMLEYVVGLVVPLSVSDINNMVLM